MNLAADRTVRELAVEIPSATRVFEKMGIDYCCGGTRSLADACFSAGVDFKDVQMELTLAAHAQVEGPNLRPTTLENLINHIVVKHHTFTRLELARLNALLEKVCVANGESHRELWQIQALFVELAADLEIHMRKEEQVLFPFVIRMEAAVQQHVPLFPPPFGTVANPVRMMMAEHDRAGELLKEIRRLSANYTPHADACMSYQTLYAALEALEKDLHQHIHLENNILFPRAVAMEPKVEAPPLT